MKKIINNILVLSFIISAFSACDPSVMNIEPVDEISETAVWDDPALIDAYINEMYLSLDHGYREHMLATLADDASYMAVRAPDFVAGILSPSDLSGFGTSRMQRYHWGFNFSAIRDVNIFLENIDDSAVNDQDILNRMKGEVHFFRAFHYHQLLRAYGGVPIIKKSYTLDDDFLAARNTFSETVDFIVEEADKAAELLPLDSRKDGTATKGAAMALKARILIHAASDLFHDNPQNDLVGYEGGDQQEMWRAAKEAAQDVIDLGKYELYDRYDDPTENYGQIFLDNTNHEEAIMSRFFTKERGDNYQIGLRSGPNGYHNWATNMPLQQFVDAYEMEDGSEFDWNNPENASAPYENRDPRFYATVSYDGRQWSQRPKDVLQHEPNSIIQTFKEVTIHHEDGSTTTRPGVDTRNGPVEDWNGTWTGYHMIKAIDPNVQHYQETQEVPWRFFRYAEILLNYAEASIELGEEADARWAINKIRDRAGMPDITDTGAELMERYRNERRIEMVFEDQRFWDIRRWKIAPEVMSENRRAIEITVEATDVNDRSTYFNYQYSVYEWGEMNWHDKMYFMPIHTEEMNRNEKLIQNPHY